jgi:ABC-type glycerol-3-phosphate transport system substrate-binding protein
VAYALAFLSEPTVCFYRTDLLGDPRLREAFKTKYHQELPTPEHGPTTWKEFADAAEFFNHQPRPGIGQPCASLPALPEQDDALDRDFYAIAVPLVHRAVREDEPRPPGVEVFSFHYDLDTGAIRIDTPGFIAALQLLQRLQRYRPGGTSAEPPVAFQDGQAVFCLAAPSWSSRFQESALVRGKFSVCHLPGSRHVFNYVTGRAETVTGVNYVPYLGAGGWIAAVPRAGSQPDAAFALAASLSNPKTSQEILIEPAWGGGVFRRSHLEDRSGWQSFDLGSRTDALITSLRETVANTRVINPVLRLRIPDERSHALAVHAEIRAALTGRKSAEQALHDAAVRWRELDKATDPKTRLDNYRLSLSLSRSAR